MTARIDETDRRILEYLHKNSRATMKEIGEKVHLTGQAVKNRLERLEDLGILKSYTVNIDCPVFGYKTHALLRLQLKRGAPGLIAGFCTATASPANAPMSLTPSLPIWRPCTPFCRGWMHWAVMRFTSFSTNCATPTPDGLPRI